MAAASSSEIGSGTKALGSVSTRVTREIGAPQISDAIRTMSSKSVSGGVSRTARPRSVEIRSASFSMR